MDTLLLRLVGPMQSWGVESRFGVRDTGREPSKSGVIGLLCAAIGRRREAAVDDLAALRMGVRVDREGRLAMDYQTIQTISVDGQIKDTKTSQRFYLADAAFLAGLEGPQALLQELHNALRDPHWMLYLGRKAFVPGEPIWLADGLRTDQSIIEALQTYPHLVPNMDGEEPEARLRVVLEDPEGELSRRDVPLSFAERRFTSRRVNTHMIQAPTAQV